MNEIFKYKLLGEIDFGNEIAGILKLNGISDVDAFLNITDECIESPLLFDNIIKARDLFVRHIDNKDTITIVVDTDADGYTSASLMYQYIRRISENIKIDYIIHKGKEHGLSDVIDNITKSKCNLLIIPDAGTSDAHEIGIAVQHNIDIIILDHHICTRGEPYCDEYPAAVVNNQMSKNITDKAMTGVGVTYKFCKVLDDYYKVNYADDYLDLLCLGMIADRCKLNLQSRYLILKGLDEISRHTNKNRFIKTLVAAQEYSLGNEVTITGIGFYIAPLINSLIRFGEYEEKCLLFEAMCNSDKMLMRKIRGQGEIELPIQEYVMKSCQSCNRKQKKVIEESTLLLSNDIEQYGLNQYPIIVCNAQDKVDKNSTGLIANKLASVYKKPCLVLRRYGDICSGSARGFKNCEIEDFNKWCKESKLFKSVDGHDNAFGASISFENTNRLFQKLSEMPASTDITYHVYNIYNASNLSDTIIKNIGKYHYLWGCDVDEPLFLVNDIVVNKYNINLVGLKQNRLQFKWHNIDFTMFSKGGSLAELYKNIINSGENIKFTIVGKFKIDTFKGGRVPQVMMEDFMFEKSDIQVGFGF